MLRTQRDGSVLRLTLDRPEVRNAFNDDLIAALAHAFGSVPEGVRIIVLSGEGSAFCAGGDLEWMRKAAAYTDEENHRDAMRLARMFRSIVECPVPVVARVQGPAFGGGCGLVAACDIAIASPNVKFAFSEVKLGLIPATISSFVISKIGRGHARALFVTGEAFDAERALRMGLIHEVTENLDNSVEAKVRAILSNGPDAVTGSKRLAYEEGLDLDECARRLALARASEEGREGVCAFLEKRPAAFVEAVKS